MGCSLILLLPSYFWIKRLEFVIPIGTVLEKELQIAGFLFAAISFSFPCFMFPETLFDSFICFDQQYKKMTRQKTKPTKKPTQKNKQKRKEKDLRQC